MKRAFVLVALFAMMWALRDQAIDLMSGDSEPLTLASIGFTALFAFTVGEVVGGLGLPRVTGYILTGIVLGPFVLTVFSAKVVADMQMFNTLALGLIATSAGLELDMKATAKVGRTLAWTVLIKLVALLVLVGGSFVAIQLIFEPFDLSTLAATIAIATVLAVLGLGTSPAIVLAVINDKGAKGRMADLVLAIAVVKDLVVVVSLAVALAVGKALVSPDGAFDPHVLLHVGQELGASIIVGVAVGAIIWAYIRYVHVEMLLFVVAMILTVAQISEFLHLELLLVFIVAGFMVRNFSPHEHDLLHPLEMVALPVFVVFFTTAGAAIDLEKTWTVLPVALALFVARLAALWIAGRLGGSLGGEGDEIRSAAWMAYVPQAGVTLGLVFLATKALPDYTQLLGSVGVALVALNLLVGPVTLGTALSAGAPKGLPSPGPDGQGSSGDATPPTTAAQPETPLIAEQLPTLTQPLARPLTAISHEFSSLLQPLITENAARHQGAVSTINELVDPSLTVAQRERQIRRFAKRPPAQSAKESAARISRRITRLAQILTEIPNSVTVTLESEHLHPPEGASRWVRLQYGLRRLQIRLRPSGHAAHRHVPLRAAMRVAWEARLLNLMTTLEDSAHRTQARLIENLEQLLTEGLDVDETLTAAQEIAEAAQANDRRDVNHAMRVGSAEATQLLHTVDTPQLRAKALQYGDHEPSITASRETLQGRSDLWVNLMAHQHHNLLLRAWLVLGHRRVRGLIEDRFLELLGNASEAIRHECERVAVQLEGVTTQLEGEDGWAPESYARIIEQARQIFARRNQSNLRSKTAKFRQQALAHQLSDALNRLIEEAPDSLRIISPKTPLTTSTDLKTVETVVVPFHAIFKHQLKESLEPALMRHHASTLELITSGPSRLTESLHVATYAMEQAVKGGGVSDAERRALALDGLSRAHERVEAFHGEITAAVEAVKADLEARLQSALSSAEREALIPDQMPAGRRHGRSALATAREAIIAGARRLRGTVDTRRNQARKAAQRVLSGQNVRSLAIRSGLERLDPAQMGAWITKHLPRPEAMDLPSLCQRVFSLNPLDDRRFLIQRRTKPYDRLKAIVGSESPSGRVSVLIEGAGGSGKTSLLNLIQLELAVQRLIRLEAQPGSRAEGLIGALAAELDVPPDVEAIDAHLSRRPTAVLIDGLEHWFDPTLAGTEAMLRFQQLLVRVTGGVFWIVTASSSAMVQIDQLTACRLAFSHRIPLKPLDQTELRQLITARHQLTGMEARFDGAGTGRWYLPTPTDPSEAYFRRLASWATSPAAALYAHMLALRVEEDVIQVGPPQDLALPFLKHIGDDALTLIVELYRLGAMSSSRLDAHLRLGEGRVPQLIEMLLTAQLVEQRPADSSLQIPLHLRGAVAKELIGLSRLPRSDA